MAFKRKQIEALGIEQHDEQVKAESKLTRQILKTFKPVRSSIVEAFKPVLGGISLDRRKKTKTTRSRLIQFGLNRAVDHVESEINLFGAVAAEITIRHKRDWQAKAVQDVKKQLQAALDQAPKVNPAVGEEILKRLKTGAPLAEHFQTFGKAAAAEARQAIIEGVIKSQSVRTVAKRLRIALNIPRNQAIVTARTEVWGIRRSVIVEAYKQAVGRGAPITGYRRRCVKDTRTCAACLALDGDVAELEAEFEFHSSCRCWTEPVTLKSTGPRQTASEWFDGLSDEEKALIIPKRGVRLLKQGVIRLDDFVQRSSSKWGKHVQQKSIRQMEREGLVDDQAVAV